MVFFDDLSSVELIAVGVDKKFSDTDIFIGKIRDIGVFMDSWSDTFQSSFSPERYNLSIPKI